MNEMITIFLPVVFSATIIVLVQLFRKLGYDISQKKMEVIIWKIVDCIITVVQEFKGASGATKKSATKTMALGKLSYRESEMIRKKYGNLNVVVEQAFQQSNLSTKIRNYPQEGQQDGTTN